MARAFPPATLHPPFPLMPRSFAVAAFRLAAVRRLAAAFAVILALPLRADVNISLNLTPTVDTSPARISPYIYGTNDNLPGVPFTLRRQGGNRMTGYNWETNASNAGADYFHQSDDYLTWKDGITGAAGNVPGLVMTRFQDQNLAASVSYSIVTLPMAGYVAADKDNRRLTAADAAPSPRWNAVVNQKPTAFSATPDLTDGKVYTDEMINLLVTRYGPASGATGIKAYSLDNEPDLWSAGKTTNGAVDLYDNATHPLLHPAKPLCAELITRSVDLAKTVKRMDPSAETFGFVSYGFSGYRDFQSATDWATEKTKGNYTWFVDYYLDQMKQASTTAGRRLLDVLDLHNYSEAMGGGYRINDGSYSDYSNVEWNKARMQAPRTFWDATYTENSWIGQWNKSYLPWLPKIQQSIDTFYPGTKLAFTEYAFGGEGHVSGGIAQADILGIFGRYGIYAAALWPWGSDHTYTAAAFNLYLNYDGHGGHFGDTVVKAATSDVATATVYAARDSTNPRSLHVVLLNKSYDAPTTFNLSLIEANYSRAHLYAFDASSAAITDRGFIPTSDGIRFQFTLPALTAAHLVLDLEPVIIAQPVTRLSVSTGQTLQLSLSTLGIPTSLQWRKNGVAISGATSAAFTIPAADLADAGRYDCVITGASTTVTSEAATVTIVDTGFTLQPASQAVALGVAASFTATAASSTTYQWQRNGAALAGATSSTLPLATVQPVDTGLYSAVITTNAGARTSDWALLGLTIAKKVEGTGTEVDSDIFVASNGNTFDQVLLEGAAAAITADFSLNQITRMSFIDLDNDIVQVEYSGPGTLSLTLDNPTGPALPVNYNQATRYMKGHASIVITGANEFSNVSVFSVGRSTAVNQALFKDSVTYDGIADLAFIAIASTNGRFGGVRTANANYFAHTGPTGVYAPGVTFAGPVFVGDITAFDTATPVLITGGVADARVTGGDLLQANGQPVQVRGLTQLKFTAGGDSHGHPLPAQPNRAVLMEDGNDVTARLVP